VKYSGESPIKRSLPAAECTKKTRSVQDEGENVQQAEPAWVGRVLAIADDLTRHADEAKRESVEPDRYERRY
jgi:hypothetical protein